MNEATFTRTIEDFDCEHCGTHTEGNGYTNHCPKCLWSKHVDINPGDRAETCGGMMEPVAIEGSDPYVIVHRCTRCLKERRVQTSSNDDREALIVIATKRAQG